MSTLTEDAPDTSVGAPPPPRRRRTLAVPRANTIAATLVVLGLFGFGLWSMVELRINVATIVDSVGNAGDFLGRMLPLDFPPIAETAGLIGQTLAVVIAATMLSMVLSAPLAIWAAGNTTRNKATRFGARALIVVCRAIPDVVLAIVLVRVLGLGILPGVLAMGIHSIGMIGKLYADAIEQIDEGPRTAVRATGARRLQQLIGGVFPQVLPAFVATAMHRLDINLRISVLLGFVGVAGIGKEIKNAIERLDYKRAMALALIVLILCVVMELISGAVRKAILGQSVANERRGILGLGRRVIERGSRPVGERRVSPPWTAARVRRLGYAIVAGLVVAVSVVYVLIDFAGGASGNGLWATLGRMFPPGTGGVPTETLMDAMFTTLQVAFAATIIGAILAIPVGLMAARNVSPFPRLAKLFRMFIVVVRGIPELILAIVFVIMIGLGEIAGTFALAIGAIGLLGKLVADSVEEVDSGPEQALRATGATRSQVFFAATLPQALPSFIGNLLYQLDVNIRSATLLGIVGAGGIGYYLLQASRVLEYEAVTLITGMLFAVVMVIELIAIWLRRTAGAKG
ncbi:phosphonate ABC transporter, permease protein PhnE [Stackebrandtia soli]|uniref:phosphonate ABC transporter, permease protein PhnE n=1 Tax=Stackebrandtia soli TaxID=1892856 RepID=UPI0039E92668